LSRGAKRRRDRPNLSVEVGPLVLRSPIVTASGTYGLAAEYLEGADLSRIGAFTTKSLSIFPWEGNPPPRIFRTPAGMLNSIGLQNPGVEAWIDIHMPAVERTGVAVIASVWGRTPKDFASAASALGGQRCVIAIEVNLSCPNVEEPGEIFAHSPESSADVVSAVVEAIGPHGKPVFAKLSPNVPSVVPIAEKVIDAGATGLTLTNTVLGMAVDVVRGVPALGNQRGGLSGPAIKPIVLRHVFEVASTLDEVPIIGTGGVFNGCDAAEILMAGASAVGVGTASFYDPSAPQKIAEELERLCSRNKVNSIAELSGLAIRNALP
jgi:dihydroorotate dehydrogenase (NAD+) catalytic subunit